MSESSKTHPQPSSISQTPTRASDKTNSNEVKEPPFLPSNLPQPKLRLHINDIRHSASKSFISLIPDVTSVLENALAIIIQHLYTPPRQTSRDGSSTKSGPRPNFTPCVPHTRSVTVLLRDIDGVAYTTGIELDDDHKEIHLSLAYIRKCTGYADPTAELVGVLTHELVHCYQHTASPWASSDLRPPGGLIEGIADFVRLKAGLVPPHWKRPTSAKDRPQKWDQGYQHTAYFLAWLEDVRVGNGAIGMLNDRLLRVGYIGQHDKDEPNTAAGKEFWEGLFGASVDMLWDEYGSYLDTLSGKMDIDRNSGTWEDEIVNPE
ncbi:hypothetical protein EYZ11_004372 [Aspergillus tanneri]|uniref:PBSP domain-containing protein n=1 Tax=Aspergillus tanneri TaxID=1220188 RepID=A0A4S3JRK8_9EURO|nr:uncharacterized protein ATNIH1004_000739 [Aspergillus tanneri]KAA8651841.1 hypothetical protein ATNIH1004_000739 [Aspergillus tanneri]THC96151.1 hypothetical protein EYZ11_004372 [Aspergillus tanneri]